MPAKLERLLSRVLTPPVRARYRSRHTDSMEGRPIEPPIRNGLTLPR